MTRVLLLLDQKENQQLLAAELASTHQVLVGESDADLDEKVDLCIVDGHALDRLWEKVQRRKQTEQPILLPVLLVTSRPDVKMITRHVWRCIDELIITPIEKPELRARIEVLLRARSLSLALQQRAQDAEQATRTRDEVLAMVSHDLRNPLNVILTTGSFLLDTADTLDPRQRELLEMMHRATSQMHRLIQDLLEVSSMEGGSIGADLKAEPVQPLLDEACNLSRQAAAGRGVELICECEPDLPEVRADRHRIHQVLANLIGNGVKFTPTGGSVRLSARRDGDRIRFSVVDTGAGISPEDLPHVFDRFWQARRGRDGGAGLGLAIARGIIAAHGGEIWAESVPGQGSAFLFTLPLFRADA